jgi:hypothetical protein
VSVATGKIVIGLHLDSIRLVATAAGSDLIILTRQIESLTERNLRETAKVCVFLGIFPGTRLVMWSARLGSVNRARGLTALSPASRMKNGLAMNEQHRRFILFSLPQPAHACQHRRLAQSRAEIGNPSCSGRAVSAWTFLKLFKYKRKHRCADL